MLKAGALYFAIVVAFLIAVVSTAILMLAAHYNFSYLKALRHARLSNNLQSGVAFALADRSAFEGVKIIDLYADRSDSLVVMKKPWGLFNLAVISTFVLQDTLKRAMLIGTSTDSTVLYLSDENRELSLSGATKISGNVYAPKLGIRKSYVEGKRYTNEELVYDGRLMDSERTMPPLDLDVIAELTKRLNGLHQWPLLEQKELSRSFLDTTLSFSLAPRDTLKNVKLKGNLILYADSAIVIAASSNLDGIQLYAPYIKVEEGFKGNCQLFATDSIVIGNKVQLAYPSAAAVIRTSQSGAFPQIVLGNEVSFEGIIFSYEEKKSALQTLISLGHQTQVKGEVYSTGLVKLEKGVHIAGKVSCHRFMMVISKALYENFLVDVTFSYHARSPYYLSSRLFKSDLAHKVLRWLD